jgi:hypothetical protein
MYLRPLGMVIFASFGVRVVACCAELEPKRSRVRKNVIKHPRIEAITCCTQTELR